MTYRRYIHILKLIPPYIWEMLNLLVFYKYARNKYKQANIALISERGSDARDNAMHLFRYIRTVHPEKTVFFVIDKNSSDLANVLPWGNVVYANSLKHRLLFYGAKVLISTHIMGGYTTCQSFYVHFNNHRWFRKGRKIVSIKHGITKDNLPMLYKENAGLDLLICGAKKEYDYIRQTFHYQDDEVQYTGFARFDKLSEHKEMNQLLIMPTWRRSLFELTHDKFERSEYFVMWNKLLQDSRLHNLVEKLNLNLIFYPHHEVQPYIDSFRAPNSRIIIADRKNYDVQALLMQSKLLITDFSSVYFDFAYMLKPVVYYQFDRDSFFKMHYQKGYFDYEMMGFGPVLSDPKQVIDAIEEMSARGFAPADMYKKRMEEFFPIRDNNNCKRIYEAIEKICKSEQRYKGWIG